MNKRQVKKGVSLITLIITIVVVIIISAVAINSVFRQNVIDKAKFAVSESNRVLGIEKLRTEEISYFLENGSQVATIEGFVDYLDSKGVISKEETEFEGDNKATVILDNKAVYEIEKNSNGSIDITYVGQAGSLVPLLQISVTSATTNEITVSPTVLKRNEGGTLKYYIKQQSEENYEYKGETSNTSYTYTGLEKNKVYDIKVIAENTEGLQTEATTTAVTIDIVQPDVTFTYDPDGWTNGDVKVTAVASSTPNGMTLYIGESISSCSELASTGITVTSNKPVYAVFKDSSGQYGGAAIGNVEYIDKVVPVINSIDVTTNTLTINATDSGGSNLAKYAISTVDVEPNENAFQASNVFSVSQNTPYYAWAMDGAGNVSASATNTTATIQTPTVTFTYDPDGWTNEDVKVTAVATSTPTGMTLYIGESVSSCDTLASTGITVTSNKPVYAVFK
ncbi:MAG: fibronectin type III domain-containing protein, partial [Clostridia bacterium]|nr:fibronectin type III domain-containing protein [Clostridia bacterium]